jgi:voltage-gated potassium channel
MATTEEEQEYKKIQRNFRATAGIALVVLITGSVFYHFVEKLNWLDAVYFSTITLTTVGYGDIVPHTDLGKFFTIFYVIIGIGILATFANLLLKNAVAKRQLKHPKSKQKADVEEI